MKRFISTFVAAMMLIAAMSTSVLAADYTLTLAAKDLDGNAVTELKKGDVVDVYATINTVAQSAGLVMSMKYDNTIFALKEDPETAADAEYLATFDEVTGLPTNTFVPYWYYQDYNAVTKFKWPAPPIIEKPGAQPDDGEVINFLYSQSSNIVRNPATDLVVGALRLEVIADVTVDTDTEITVWDVTAQIPGANAGELYYPTIVPTTLTIKADAPAVEVATAGAWDTGSGILVIGKVTGEATEKGITIAGYTLPEASSNAGMGPNFAATAPASAQGYYGVYIAGIEAGTYTVNAYADAATGATTTVTKN